MQLRNLSELVRGTADVALAVNSEGVIVAWNEAAERFFQVSNAEAIGQFCYLVVRGTDETGSVCSDQCSVLQATKCQQRVGNFDIQVPTDQGMQWCNISTVQVPIANADAPYAMHIVLAFDWRKRLEILVRDFIVSEAKLSPEDAKAITAITHSPLRAVELTNREIEILRLLAKGKATAVIAQLLRISRTTVNNHIQHMMQKIGAHSRLEAIRRAERAGLI